MKKYDFDDFFKKDSKLLYRSMVIYRGHHFYSFDALSDSYLNAAERILEPLLKEIKDGQSLVRDELLHPVMFLMRHSLETILKDYLSKLVEHNKKNKFSDKVRGEYKCMFNHRLEPIGQAIWEIVSEETIFQQKDFKNILQFLQRFDELDNNSTGFRYNITNEGKPQEFHEEQWWIDIFPLFNAIKEMCLVISNYANSDDFENDKAGLYTNEFLTDIDKKLACTSQFIKLMEEAGFSKETEGSGDLGFDKMIDSYKQYAQKVGALTEIIKRNKLSDEDICNACMGMYFGRDGGYPKMTGREEAESKLLEKGYLNLSHHQERANKRVERIKEKLSIKNKKKV